MKRRRQRLRFRDMRGSCRKPSPRCSWAAAVAARRRRRRSTRRTEGGCRPRRTGSRSNKPSSAAPGTWSPTLRKRARRSSASWRPTARRSRPRRPRWTRPTKTWTRPTPSPGAWANGSIGGKAQRARPLAWLARPPPAASSVRSVKVTGCLRWLSSVASQRLRTRSGRYARAARSDKCVSTHMEVHLSIKIHNEKPHREGARGPSVGPASSRGGESSCRLSSARKRVGTLLHMRVEFLVELILEMAELVMEVLERALKRRHGRARIVCRLHPHEEPVVQWVRDLIRRKPDVAVVEQLLPHEVADSVVLLFDDRRAAVLGLLESLVRNLNLIVVH
mmetsp:Transcript_92994/g.265486  ORF Transcript_92994/g.265486 Transcript_92994/m.265486 type:complete len:334 (+) Transcript_92994:383-1384(+)